MHRLIGWILLLTLAPVTQAELLKVGIENLEYAPYYTPTGGGKTAGVSVQILEKFAKDNGHTLELSAFPVARLLPSLLNGEVDFKFPDNAHWAGEAKQGKVIIYSEEMLPSTGGVMVLPGNKGNTTIKILGAVRGFTPWPFNGAIQANSIALKETSNIESLLKLTAAGRVDGAYIDISVAKTALDTFGMTGQLVFDEALPNSADAFSLSTITKPAILEEFNAFLRENRAWIDQLITDNGIQ